MRIFQTEWMPVENKRLPLKESLQALEAFLTENGLYVQKLWAPSHPELSPEEVREKMRRIPRPWNPDRWEVRLDGVSWFGEPPGEPCLREGTAEPVVLSDSVQLFRYAGNGFYHLHFQMEVTGPDGTHGLRDSREIREKIEKWLGGKLRPGSRDLVFTPEEREALAAGRAQMEEDTAAVRAAVGELTIESGDLWELLRKRLSGELPSTSVKKAVRRYFPSPDYRYFYDGTFYLTRQTPRGFLLEARLDSPPNHAVLHGQVALRGPGVERENRFAVDRVDWLHARAERGDEFPCGIEIVLVDPEGRVVAIPRSSSAALVGDPSPMFHVKQSPHCNAAEEQMFHVKHSEEPSCEESPRGGSVDGASAGEASANEAPLCEGLAGEALVDEISANGEVR